MPACAGGGDRDVGRGDRVGDGGRVQGGEAEIGHDTGGGSGVVLDRERAGPFGPDAVEIGIVRVGETIREGQGGGLRRNRSGAEVVMAGIDAANAGQARRGDGRIVGDELQDIIDKEFHLIADHFEAQGAAAAEARQIGGCEFAVAVEAGSDIFDENVGDEAPLEAVDHAEVEIIFGRSGVARHEAEAGALGVGEDDIDLHDDVGEREAVDGGDADLRGTRDRLVAADGEAADLGGPVGSEVAAVAPVEVVEEADGDRRVDHAAAEPGVGTAGRCLHVVAERARRAADTGRRRELPGRPPPAPP